MNKYNYIIHKYDILVKIDTINLKYNGCVKINIEIINDITDIKINYSKLKIKSINIDNNIINWSEYKDEEYLKIKYDFFKKKKYQIIITFDNNIDDDLDGLYYSKNKDKLVLCTHFEPRSARKFIPCFDEPDLKAIFIVNVIIDSKYNVISNSSLNKIVPFDNGLTKKFIFNPSPKMSTYLLCIVAGDIYKNEKKSLITNDFIKINGYSLKKNLKKISWSIIQTKKALEFFSDWFNIKYPLFIP